MNKIHIGILLRVLGILLCFEALFMFIPTIVAFVYNEPDRWAFLVSSIITLLVGGTMAYRLRNCRDVMGRRDGVLLGTSVWIIFALMGMLPFLCVNHSFTDAMFETISAVTTTGASVYKDIDNLPHGILLWRSMLQWIGGIGMILFTVAVLPMLNHRGGMILLSTEVSGMGQYKLSPRISQTALRLWLCYFIFTAILFILLYAGSMNVFDAVCHSLSTMATGGFSTHNESVGYFHSAYIEYVITLFTFIAGINFAIIYRTVMSEHQLLFRSEQVKWYTMIIVACTVVFTVGLFLQGTYPTIELSFRKALFQVCSVITSTGFSADNTLEWGPFYTLVLLTLMFFGACAGSTTGGAKIDRMVILTKNARNEFHRVIHPNVIRPVLYNGKVLSHETVSRVLAFTIMYVIVWISGAVVLALQGASMGEAVYGSLSALSNMGIGIGADAGGYYSDISYSAKWTLMALMVIGRLEIFTVIIIFMPLFWKKS